MNKNNRFYSIVLMVILFLNFNASASNNIPANDPYIQYFGRWDFSDPLAPSHSWPGVYIYAEFEGTSIGVKLNDNFCYYNVFIDGALAKVFHGTVSGIAEYELASGLTDGHHTILFTKRNETTFAKFSFHGFILDDEKTLTPPPAKPERKIEFVGDSFTSASGNEYTKQDKPANDADITNIYEGFGPITARFFGAQYTMTSRSGYGLVMDWQGSYAGNIPDIFGNTHIYTSVTKWDFEQWIPNLVVIGLGLNDYSGFGGWESVVTQTETDLYKTRYHDFISTIRDVYPGVKIMAVAAHVEWMQTTISKVVEEEKAAGHNDVFYASYPYYEGGYVYEGHPNVDTHHKIAERLIAAIDTINAWETANDKVPPKVTFLPESGFTVYDTKYTLKVKTDSYASLRYSTQDKSYDQMEFEFTITGKREHTVDIECEHGRQYNLFIRAEDINGNKMDTSAVVSFDVDTTKILLNWYSPGYNDADWQKGNAPLGYAGTAALNTITSPVTTLYLRQSVNISNAAGLSGIAFSVKGSHGAVAYLNGIEVSRLNLFENEDINYDTYTISSSNLNKVIVINDDNGLEYLKEGENVIAVEMHTTDAVDAGISFDSHFFDSNNKVYYKFGSEWKFYDAGQKPSAQLQDKVTGVPFETAGSVPEKFSLLANYPNPFNPATTIEYSIPKSELVSLIVYDILGRQVDVLVKTKQEQGKYSVEWNAANFVSGIYFYKLNAGGLSQTCKMILLR